jgi:hypothetical protein
MTTCGAPHDAGQGPVPCANELPCADHPYQGRVITTDSTDFVPLIGDGFAALRGELEELYDELHIEGIHFVRGLVTKEWYARSTTDHPQYLSHIWWKVTGAIPDDLDGIMERAREIGNE